MVDALKGNLCRASAAVTCVMLAACGGGGDAPASQVGASAPLPPTASALSTDGPSGIYGGAIQGFASPKMLYFAAGQLPFALLGVASPTGFSVQSFLLISRTGASWTPAGEPGWVYNSFEYVAGPTFPDAVVGYSVQVTHNPATPSLTGTMSSRSGSWQISGGRVEYSDYDFNRAMSVSEVVGQWDLRDLANGPARIDIDAQGGVSGTYQGCAMAGSVAPAADHKGYLRLSVSLDSATCPSRFGTAPVPYQGFVVAYRLSGDVRQMVMHAGAQWEGPNFPEADSMLALGVR
jgi:hypothetical protein